jgi:hypothetical protein
LGERGLTEDDGDGGNGIPTGPRDIKQGYVTGLALHYSASFAVLSRKFSGESTEMLLSKSLKCFGFG